MGSGRFSHDDWKSYATSSSYDTKSTSEIFNSSSLDKDLDPKGVVRESRDSADNPNSTAIILGLDVTGSMGMIADNMARKGVPTLCTEIYDRKPVTDPHILCAGIGDAEAGDSAPFQVTQFEADIRISKQLEKLYLEHGGGGNHFEGYAQAWYFAAMHTKIDCFEKRGKKGYLFTIGDEEPTPQLRAGDLVRVFGDGPQSDLSISDVLTMVSRQWEVFHIIVKQGNHCRSYFDRVKEKWTEVLGQRAIVLTDYEKLAETITSVIQVNEGADKDKVVGSWDKSTALVVSSAVKNLTVSKGGDGVVTL